MAQNIWGNGSKYTYDPQVTLEVGYEIDDAGDLPVAQVDAIEDIDYEIVDPVRSSARSRPKDDQALVISGQLLQAVLDFVLSLVLGILKLVLDLFVLVLKSIFSPTPPSDNSPPRRRTIEEEETIIYHHRKRTYRES